MMNIFGNIEVVDVPQRKLTPAAQKFIKRHIRKERKFGVPQKQAIAISFSKAEKRGFKINKR